MLIKKLLTFICIIILSVQALSANMITSTNQFMPETNINNLDCCESHIIEGVPYVSQETGFYCGYASITMALKYYGINITLSEVIHHMGVGYSLGYSRIGLKRVPIPGHLISQTPFDREFLAGLFNATSSSWFPLNQKGCSIDLNWEDYWLRVKQNITNNIPVITGVDPYSIPYYRKIANITDNETHGGHTIILIGFNNSHVFYNDPATALNTCSEDGFYANISIDTLKKAVSLTLATKFWINIFKNTSTTSYPKKEVFEKAHNRNIKRLKSMISGYVPGMPDLKDRHCGIKAVKLFRYDFGIGLTRRFTTILNYGRLNKTSLNINSYGISVERYNVSQYLLENQHLSEICRPIGLLLQNESKCWNNVRLHILEICEISKGKNILKTLFLTLPITNEIRRELTKIITIENSIIKGVY